MQPVATDGHIPSPFECFQVAGSTLRSTLRTTGKAAALLLVLSGLPLVVGMAPMSPAIASLTSLLEAGATISVGGLVLTRYAGAVGHAMLPNDGTALAANGQFRSGWASVALASILVFAFCLVGALFLLLPGVYLGIRLAFTWNVLGEERVGAFAAIRMSWLLTKRRSLALFSILTVSFLPALGVLGAYVAVAMQHPNSAATNSLLALYVAVSVLSTIFAILAITPLYYAVRATVGSARAMHDAQAPGTKVVSAA